MSPDQWSRVKNLFDQAVDLSGEARAAFLAQACGDDRELRNEIEQLLEDSAGGPGMLSQFAERTLPLLHKDSQPNFAPGTILARRFRVVRFLARGGMGEVYECEDTELGEHVALKTIRPEIAGDEHVLAMFKREIQLARKVTHPHVCRIYDLVQHQEGDASTNLLSMELVTGRTLAQYLKEHGPLTPAQALPWIEQMTSALEAAHQAGVVHRDFKPGNVMLSEGAEDRAVVMDFGLAFPAAQADTGTLMALRGTLNFMAPEQQDGGPITPATDIYALGLVIREMVGGSSGVWEPVLQRCLQRDPQKRYTRPSEVSRALRTALYGKPTGRRLRWTMGAAAGFAIAVALIAQPWRTRPVADFQKGDWVLLGGFENRTGNPLFNDLLPAALARELSITSFVSVAGPQRIDDTLRLMKRAPGTPLDRDLAREVALRDGGIVILVTGRAENKGPAYLLTVELVDPVSGRILADNTEEASTTGQVWPAVRRLSSWVRESVGEEMTQIDRTNRQMERVTTPSLRALRAFSLADAAAKRSDWPSAAESARQAVAEDPNFASAHLWLAWALRNLRRPEWEYEMQRARELRTNVTERERLFIDGSYYMMTSQESKAVPVLEELVKRYPDHFFGYGNLANAYARLNRQKDAADALARVADLRPNDYRSQVNVAWRILNVTNDPIRASQYARRARALSPPDPKVAMDATVLLTPFYAAWETGGRVALTELETALPEVELFRRSPQWRGITMSVADQYLALGRIRSAREWLDRAGWPLKSYAAYVAYVAGDREEARAILARTLPDPDLSPEARILAIRLRPPGVDQVIESSLKQFGLQPNGPRLFPGEVALSQGRLSEAVALLQDTFDSHREIVPIQMAAEALAEAYDRSGDPRKAIEVLEQAQTLQMGARPNYWIRNLAHLLRYYREFGRDQDAQRLEVELRTRLEVADPGFWILKELH